MTSEEEIKLVGKPARDECTRPMRCDAMQCGAEVEASQRYPRRTSKAPGSQEIRRALPSLEERERDGTLSGSHHEDKDGSSSSSSSAWRWVFSVSRRRRRRARRRTSSRSCQDIHM